MPEGATFHRCNVKNWSEIVTLFRETRKMHGKIDIVCANAGMNDRVNFLGDNEDEPNWDVLDVNLKGVMMSKIPFSRRRGLTISYQGCCLSFQEEYSSGRGCHCNCFYHVFCSRS